MNILAATNNKHKIIEFKSILKPLGIKFVAPSEIGGILDTDETASTFEGNASLKALEAAKFAKMSVFADDSGLEIKALNNAPGIFSSRYADTDENRIVRILRELKEEEDKTGIIDRAARFVCVIAFANEEKVLATFRGEVYGEIIYEPKGDNGFGYDPVFMPDNFTETFAELSSEIKDSISHRSKALQKAKEFFESNNLKKGK